jgi:hypothetical protein
LKNMIYKALYVSRDFDSAFRARAGAREEDIGECKSIKIRGITETSRFDNDQLMRNIKDAGGPKANRYAVKWDPKNTGGCKIR